MKQLIILFIIALPGWGAIARTGSGAATATSATVSATNTGDLKIVWAYDNGTATAPSLPAGWTNIANGTRTSAGYRIACNVSSSSGDTGSGTWTNATAISIVSYSGTGVTTTAACRTTGIGAIVAANNSNTTPSFTTITLTRTPNSWVAGFLGSNNASVCTPAGMTQIAGGTTGAVEANDTNAVTSTWATTTCTITSGVWMLEVVEIMPSTGCQGETYGTFTCVSTTGLITFAATENVNVGTITAGDLVFIMIKTNDVPSGSVSITVATQSGCTGASWVTGTQITNATNYATNWAWGAPSGACTVTIAQTGTGAVQASVIVVHNSSNVVDPSSGTYAVDDGFVSNPTTPSITTTANGDFVIASMCDVNSFLIPAHTITAGWTEVTGGGSAFSCQIAVRSQASLGAISTTWTVAASTYVGTTVGFKKAATGTAFISGPFIGVGIP